MEVTENVTVPGSDSSPLMTVTEGDTVDNTGGNNGFISGDEQSVKALGRIFKQIELEDVPAKEEASDSNEEEKDEEEGSEEGSEKEPTKEVKKDEEVLEEAPSEPPAREVVFMVGDKEVRMSENALIDVTVDGKVRKIPLSEALKSASGEIAVKDRFAKFQSEKARAENQLRKQQTDLTEKEKVILAQRAVLENVQKLTASGKPIDLFGYLAHVTGRPVKEVLKTLLTQSSTIAQQLSSSSPEVQEAFYERLETSVERQKLASERKRLEDEQNSRKVLEESRQAEAYVRSELAQMDSTEDDFRQMADHLQKKGVVLQGATIQDKADEILERLHERRVISIAKDIDPALLNNQKLLQKVFDVTLTLGEGYRKTENIKSIFREFSEQEKKAESKRIAETLSRKVRANGATPQKAQEASAKDEAPFSLTEFHRRKRRF